MSEEEGSETPPQMEGISTLPPGYNVVLYSSSKSCADYLRTVGWLSFCKSRERSVWNLFTYRRRTG